MRDGVVPPLLRESAEFRRFWNGQAISQLGDQISLIALPLVAVLELDAGAAQMGYLATAALVPNLLFSLHAGAWVDRRGRRRRTMIAADLGRAALTASVPVAWAFDALTIEQLYVVAFLGGSLSVLFFVSYSTLFTAIVPRERYVDANSLVHGSRALSYVAGPSIGGFEPAERGHLAAGARFIWNTPSLRAALASTAWVNLFNFVFFALFVLFATETLHVRPGTLGLVLGAGAVGGVLGSLVTRRISQRIGIGPTFALGTIVFPAPLLLVPLAGGPKPVVLALLFLAEFGSGLGVMILDISVGSIFQALVPDRLRARFSGAYMVVNYGVRPIGTFAGGLLGSTIGLRPTLWIATAGALGGVLFLLPSPLMTMRELPEAAE